MEIKIKIESNTSISDALKLSSRIIKSYPDTPLNKYQVIQVRDHNTVSHVRLCRTKTGYTTEIVGFYRDIV